MKVVIDLNGEAAEQYMQDRLSASIRRLMSGNDGACEWDIALEIRMAFEQSHIVKESEE